MRWRCRGLMREDGEGPKVAGMIFGISMMSYMVLALWLTFRITHALESLATTSALDDMEDQLSDGEKAELEGRARENLFGE